MGKKWYWVGPQIGADFKSTDQYSAGTYYIKVYNKDNKGKYVLAVGDDERFGIGTMLKLRGIMKETSEIFWESEGCKIAASFFNGHVVSLSYLK